MKEHLRAVVAYSATHDKADLRAYAPELEPTIVNYLNESINGLASDNTQLFLDAVASSQKDSHIVHIANEAWTHLEIGPTSVLVYDKVPGTDSTKKIVVSTNDIKDLVLTWANIYDSFKSAQSNSEAWHGIALHKNSTTDTDALCWNPWTDEVSPLYAKQ